MLDLSWSHILILLIVALVVVGPKDLPRLMRIVGQWMGKARKMADEFRKSFDDMARQSELDELRKEIENLRHERPLADVERDLNRSILPDDMRDPAPKPSIEAEPVEIESAPAPRSGESEIPSMPDPHAEEVVVAEPAAPIAADGLHPPAP
ncbi:MAG: Sec-independent protein translocase protein TatB [Rhizomicrobium sp.]